MSRRRFREMQPVLFRIFELVTAAFLLFFIGINDVSNAIRSR